MSNKGDFVINMQPMYAHVARCSAVEATVAEVGLGEGHAAKAMLSNPKCNGLDSFEIDSAAVANYKAQEALDARHEIVEGNFITDNGNRKYHFIYIDVLYGDDASTDNAIAIVEQAKNRLLPKGKIAIEWWADNLTERRMRDYMKANFVEHESERCGERGDPKMYIKYWTVE